MSLAIQVGGMLRSSTGLCGLQINPPRETNHLQSTGSCWYLTSSLSNTALPHASPRARWDVSLKQTERKKIPAEKGIHKKKKVLVEFMDFWFLWYGNIGAYCSNLKEEEMERNYKEKLPPEAENIAPVVHRYSEFCTHS